jgi:hypothetical protein
MNAVDEALLQPARMWDPDQVDRPVIVLPMQSGPGIGAWISMPIAESAHGHECGLITLETDAGVCVVPPRSAAWIGRHAASRQLQRCGQRLDRCGSRRGASAPLSCAGRLAISACPTGARAGLPQDYEPDDGDGRLMQVLIDEIQAAQPEGLHLPMPVTACAA